MKDFIEILIKLLESWGLEASIANRISLVLLAALLIFFVLKYMYSFISYCMLKRNQNILNRDLSQFYTKSDVERATEFYIPSRYQNVAPSEDDEPGRKYIASAKGDLISLFLDAVFTIKGTDNKYYLILADTGMGKTTFMINLYLRYKNESFLIKKHKFTIKLIPLGSPSAFNKIQSIDNKENTILLLDAFDEDVKAVDRHKERMHELLEIIQEFRCVIITCRTQFFPSEEEEPYKTGYYTFGNSNKEYSFQKLYLSVFDNGDIKKYLKKRFHFSLSRNYKKAKRIAEKSPNLVVRPLLLSHIHDLIDSTHDFEFSFQIYGALIEKWIERESNKPGMAEKYASPGNYKILLLKFSENLAIDLYENRKQRGGYFINKNESISNNDGLLLEDVEIDYVMSDTEKKTKSLLNRNSLGQYKFSHKSIFEYFLALRLINDMEFLSSFDFDGMDAAKKFLKEISITRLRKLTGFFLLERQSASWFSLTSKYNSAALDKLILTSYEELLQLTILDPQDFKYNYAFLCEKLEILENPKTAFFKEFTVAIAFSLYSRQIDPTDYEIRKNTMSNSSEIPYSYFSYQGPLRRQMHYDWHLGEVLNSSLNLIVLARPRVFEPSAQIDKIDFEKYTSLFPYISYVEEIILSDKSSKHNFFRSIGRSYFSEDLSITTESNYLSSYSNNTKNKPLIEILKLWLWTYLRHGKSVNDLLEDLDHFDKTAKEIVTVYQSFHKRVIIAP